MVEVNAREALRNADCGLRNADCGMRIAECGLRTARLREPGTRSGARDGSVLRMKSDPFPGRRRLSDELFNCGEDSRKLLTRFLQIARPLTKRTMPSIPPPARASYSSKYHARCA